MGDNLVVRLRAAADDDDRPWALTLDELLIEAADEIERLRDLVDTDDPPEDRYGG